MPDGVLSVVKSGKETELEWKISNFSLSGIWYRTPDFKFEGESWWLFLCPNKDAGTYGYMYLTLWRSLSDPHIEVEFSLSVKTTEGSKSFERRERRYFTGLGRGYYIKQWICRSEFSNRQREFLSSGCLTILITMMKAGSGESEIASVAGVRQRKSSRRLNQPITCPKCAEIVSFQDWFRHECHPANVKTASVAAACSYCKGDIHGGKISFHKECLNKEAKCPRCDEVVSLQKWFDHVCQKSNVPGESSTSQMSRSDIKDKTAQDWKKLFFNLENCDVILKVQGQEFPAHQAILAVRSPVFACLFHRNLKETVTGTVDIDDIDPNCFSDFLRFIYCGKIESLSFENVRSFFTAADKYGVTDLRKTCLEFMKRKISDEISLRKTYIDSFQS